MRTRLTVFLMLLALGAAAFAVLPAAVNARQDAVTLTEERVYGDAAAAEGLWLELDAACGGRLHWTTRAALGTTLTAETAFSYTAQPTYPVAAPESYLFLQSDYGSAGVHGGAPDESYFGALSGVVQEAMDRTAPATRHVETVSLADRLAWDPVRLYGEWDGDSAYEAEIGDFWPEAASFFRLPLPEDAAARVSVARDEAGNVREVQLDPVRLPPGTPGTQSDTPWDGTFDDATVEAAATEVWNELFSAFSEDGAYVAVSCCGPDGARYAPDTVTAGYGVYFLPSLPAENRWGEPTRRVDAAAVRRVFPLDLDAPAVGLDLTADGSRLLVRTEEDGGTWLTVVDRATMTARQKLRLFPERDLPIFRVLDGGVVAMDNEQQLRYLAWEDGQYVEKIAADLGPARLEGWEMEFYFDGRRLLLSAGSGRECGVEVAVCDASGLRYAAKLRSSLDQSADYGEEVHAAGSRVRLGAA